MPPRPHAVVVRSPNDQATGRVVLDSIHDTAVRGDVSMSLSGQSIDK